VSTKSVQIKASGLKLALAQGPIYRWAISGPSWPSCFCFIVFSIFCFYRKVEGRQSDSSGMSGLVDETLGHLTSDHMTYFIQWCLMLDLESQLGQSKKTLADIWYKSSVKRYDFLSKNTYRTISYMHSSIISFCSSDWILMNKSVML
jgi:hypothetical protein